MNKNSLLSKVCTPCEGSEEPLGASEIAEYLNAIEGWALTNEGTLLFREYEMHNFMEVVGMINKIAAVAEEQGHHPDLHLTDYKKLRVDLSTHAIGGLSENDFIMAAKIEKVFFDH